MSQDHDSIGIEQATAVAAAAYAISKLKDSSDIQEQKKITSQTRRRRKEATSAIVPSPEQRKITENPEPSFPRVKSRKEPTPASFSIELGEGSRKHPETPTQEKIVQVPSMKKSPTFAEEKLNRTHEIQPENLKPKPEKPEVTMPKPDVPATNKPEPSSAKFDRQPTRRPETGGGGTQADIWETEELDRIRKKYEELNARILSWENKKKAKSRKRLDKAEQSELERKRLKGLKEFHSDVDDINQIAGGARAKAKERQRKEELKAKEKANQIRKTGQLPTSSCPCF